MALQVLSWDSGPEVRWEQALHLLTSVMESSYLRLFRLNFAALLVAIVTLFASFQVFAQQKDSYGKQKEKGSPSKQNGRKERLNQQNMEGGNVGAGGKGGGAVICDGQQPVLTDYFEAVNSDEVANSLKLLRQKNYEESLRYFANRFFLLEGQYAASQSDLYIEMKRMMDAVKAAIKNPAKAVRYQYKLDIVMNVTVKVDRNIQDPDDTGHIVGLEACREGREERVVVTKLVGERVSRTQSSLPQLTISIKNPDVFAKMPIFDQVGMIIGHEVIHASSSGHIVDLASVNNINHHSVFSRALNAWVALGPIEDIKEFRKYGPLAEVNRSFLCISIGPAGSGTWDYSSDETAFRLYIDDMNKKTIFQLIYFKKQPVWLTTYAELPYLSRATDLAYVPVNGQSKARAKTRKKFEGLLEDNKNLLSQVSPDIGSGLGRVASKYWIEYQIEPGRNILTIRNASEVILNKNVHCFPDEK